MIKLMKDTFTNEKKTKKKLCKFIKGAKILSMGKECEKFEKRFSKWQGRKYSVLFNSGSSANLALWQAIKNLKIIKDNSTVGFSALTWATNVMPIIQMGYKVKPIDVSLNTLNVSRETLEEGLNINALFLTNALGMCDDIEAIARICRENGIFLFEDNCESLGSEYKEKKLGNFGIASTFSFFVGHHLSTIEGGMICTDSEILRNELLMVRSHGWDRSLPEDYANDLRVRYSIDLFKGKYTFYSSAYNLRPMEMTGVIGNIQMDYLDDNIDKRENNFNRFREVASKNTDIIPLEVMTSKHSNFAFPIVLKSKSRYLHYRNKAITRGIEIRPIIGGDITKQPFMKDVYFDTLGVPNVEVISEYGFYLPNRPDLTEREIKKLSEVLKNDYK